MAGWGVYPHTNGRSTCHALSLLAENKIIIDSRNVFTLYNKRYQNLIISTKMKENDRKYIMGTILEILIVFLSKY